MGKVKGSAVTSRIRYVREHSDEPTWRAIRARLSPESQAWLEEGVLPHAWVPYQLFVELNVEADRVLGDGDLALCREMGRYGARVNLPTLYRIFLRFGSVPFILRKASRLWEVHYDSGHLEVDVREDAGEAEVRICGFAAPHRAHCLSVLGWAVGAGEATGAIIEAAEERACRTRGAEECRFLLRWRD